MEEKRLTMKDYVVETPSCVEQNLAKGPALTERLVEEYVKKDYRRVIVVASGSSRNGSICAQPFMHKLLKKEVQVVSPFAFSYFEEFDENDFIVVCSQSGRSTNAIEAAQRIKDKGLPVISLVGNLNSDLTEMSDVGLEWGVGIEKVGYVTKGVVSLALYFMVFALEAAKKQGLVDESGYAFWRGELAKSVAAHKELQASALTFIEKHPKQLLSMDNVWIVSAGSNMGTAIEGALKIGETIHIHATAYETEEFLHGPVFPITPAYTVLVIDSNNAASPRIHAVWEACKKVTDRAYLITDSDMEGDDVIRAKTHLAEEVQPLAYLAVCPLLAEYASEALQTLPRIHPLYREFSKVVQTKTPKRDT